MLKFHRADHTDTIEDHGEVSMTKIGVRYRDTKLGCPRVRTYPTFDRMELSFDVTDEQRGTSANVQKFLSSDKRPDGITRS